LAIFDFHAFIVYLYICTLEVCDDDDDDDDPKMIIRHDLSEFT